MSAESVPMIGRVRAAVEKLPPGYFALVMATGIISVGLKLEGFLFASDVLLAVAVGAYVVLIVLMLWQVIAFRQALVGKLTDPATAFQFFTFVAATNVLGSRLALDWGLGLPTVLLAVSIAVWLIAGYAIPWAVMLGRRQQTVLTGVDGTWFIWAVASQSVAVLSAGLERALTGFGAVLSVVAILAWSIGLLLYAIIGMLVVMRLVIHGIEPGQFGPAFWVAMGAVAITILAGSRIVEMTEMPMVAATRGVVAGASVVLWCFATWLIPVLVAIGWWRHIRHRVPLRYEPGLWSIIFPLGMYSVAGIYLGEADHLPVVGWIGSAWLWVAVAAWLVTVVAMFARIAAVLFGGRSAR